MSVPMDPESIRARLRHASRLADLRPEHRLYGKLDMGPRGIRQRLKLASDLAVLCQTLRRARRVPAHEGSRGDAVDDPRDTAE